MSNNNNNTSDITVQAHSSHFSDTGCRFQNCQETFLHDSLNIISELAVSYNKIRIVQVRLGVVSSV